MAHFARIKDNNILNVIVVSNDVLENKEFPESEPIGIAFCKSLFGEDTEWVQTSYNNNFRGIYAGSADFYDPETGTFKYTENTQE